jgi:hypothetical protein
MLLFGGRNGLVSWPTVLLLSVGSLKSYWSIEKDVKQIMVARQFSSLSSSSWVLSSSMDNNQTAITQSNHTKWTEGSDVNAQQLTEQSLLSASPPSSSSTTTTPKSSLPYPDSTNTVIALIAMGDAATKTYLAERCISSIRARGEWDGHILLLTDSNQAVEKYNRTLILGRDDDKIILRQATPKDLEPHDDDGNPLVYKTQAMIFKRFKTKLVEYIQMDNIIGQNLEDKGTQHLNTNKIQVVENIEYFFYLDIDNVVTQPLKYLWQSIHDKVMLSDYPKTAQKEQAEEHELAGGYKATTMTATTNDLTQKHQKVKPLDTTAKPFSFISAWRERDHYQMGQIFFHKDHGKGCLDAWQGLIDTSPTFKMEQPLMVMVIDDYERYRCRMFELPDRSNTTSYPHFRMLSNKYMPHLNGNSIDNDFPTIIHISGMRVGWYTVEQHLAFLKTALDLKKNVSGSNDKNIDALDEFYANGSWGNVTWRQILQPGSPRGHQPRGVV